MYLHNKSSMIEEEYNVYYNKVLLAQPQFEMLKS